MQRRTLDTGLLELQAGIMQAGSQIREKLGAVLTSLLLDEYHGLRHIIEGYPDNEMHYAMIEQQAIHLLVSQQPLEESDVRFLTVVLAINNHFARMEETLTQTASLLLHTALFKRQAELLHVCTCTTDIEDQFYPPTSSRIFRNFIAFGKSIEHLLCATSAAFLQRDAEMAQAISTEIQREMHKISFFQKIADMHRMGETQFPERGSPTIEHFAGSLWITHKLVEMAISLRYICKQLTLLAG